MGVLTLCSSMKKGLNVTEFCVDLYKQSVVLSLDHSVQMFQSLVALNHKEMYCLNFSFKSLKASSLTWIFIIMTEIRM